jgi:hypothetical protein
MRKFLFGPASSRRLRFAAFFITLLVMFAGCNKKNVALLTDETTEPPSLPSPVRSALCFL